MHRIIFILLLISVLSCDSNGQGKVLFHKWEPTASSANVIEWNVDSPNEKKWIIKETVDSRGRVKKLEFLKDGSLESNKHCFLANNVTFEYGDNQIIETLFHFDKEILATDCEMWYKSIYHLNSKNQIEKIERFSKYDSSNVDSGEIEKWKTEWAPERSIVKADSVMLEVDYYYHSFAKMGGIYPVSENYVLDEDNYYYGDEPEKSSIMNGLKN